MMKELSVHVLFILMVIQFVLVILIESASTEFWSINLSIVVIFRLKVPHQYSTVKVGSLSLLFLVEAITLHSQLLIQ
jgi:hypothetical protein